MTGAILAGLARRAGRAAAVGMMLLLQAGAVAVAQTPAPTAPSARPVVAGEQARYALQPGDTVNVTVFGHADLSGDFVIDEAGAIVLPIGGSVAASGLSATELEARVTAVLADGYIIRPNVAVRIAAQRPVYVMGDVRTAGAVAFRPGMTALTAVAMAGGLASTQQDTLALRASLREAEERLALMRTQHIAVRARIARLIAQRDGAEKVAFPRDLEEAGGGTAQLLASERAVLATERSAEASQLAVWVLRLKSAETEVVAIAEQVKLETAQLDYVGKYYADLAKLQRKGLVDRRRLVEMQMEEARLKANIARLETDSGRATQLIHEAPLRMSEIRAGTGQRALLALQEANARRAELESSIAATQDQVAALHRRFAAAGGVVAASGTGLVLTRATGPRSGTYEIEETAPLRPGDILRVTGRTDAVRSQAALRSSSPPDPGRN